MSYSLYATLALNAISATLILAIAAIGLWIILGMMGVINLAHGAFIGVGAYTVWLFQTELGISFWLGLIMAPVIVGLLGLIVEYTIVRFLYDRLIDTLLATWGASIIIIEMIKVVIGDDPVGVSTPLSGRTDLIIVQYPSYRLFLIVFSIAILVSIYVLFTRTNFGIRLRSVLQNDGSAELLGIDRENTYRKAFILGSALAGISGAMLAPLVSIRPALGNEYLIQSFLTIILGGVGSPLGVVPGAAFIAGLESLGTYYIEPVVAQTAVFAVVIAIIMARPPIKKFVARKREKA